jgi:hypothetical protein
MVARRMSMEIPARYEEHGDLYWLGHPESKTYVQFRGGIMWESSAPEEGVDVVLLRGARSGLILTGVPWVTSWFPSILVGYNRESLSELVCLVLYSKLSSCPWAHMSGRGGPTDMSTGLLVGWGRLRPWSVGIQGYPCLWRGYWSTSLCLDV